MLFTDFKSHNGVMALADLHYEEGIESVLRVQRTSKLRKPAICDVLILKGKRPEN